jgi:AcrR family transcriptional regulator
VGTRARRKPLSRDRVLTAAVELADSEGLSTVTMRRLAASLGVEAMSLYHHLPGKDGLLDGLVETVVAEVGTAVAKIEGEASPEQWQQILRSRFLAAREVMLRHPWAPALIGSRNSIPAGVYTYYEAILATLIRGGFSYHLAHRTLHAFGSMPLGFVQELFSPAPTGLNVESTEAMAELAQWADALPHLTAMVASEIHDAGDDTLGWCDSQPEFEFTLDLLLDGLARHID